MSGPLYSVPGVYFESPRGQDVRLKGVPIGVAGFIGYCSPRPAAFRQAQKNANHSTWPIVIETPEQIDERIFASDFSHIIPALRGFFNNGGRRAFVVGIPDDAIHNPVSMLGGGEPGARYGLAALDAADEVELLVAPDLFMTPPGAKTPELADVLSAQSCLLDFCKGSKDGETISQGGYFALLDAPPGLSEQNVLQYAALLRAHPAAEFGAFFYPWIDLPMRDGSLYRMPSSPQVAGIMSKQSGPPTGMPTGSVASDLGPHLSPANQPLIDAVATETLLGRLSSRELLESGINCMLAWSGRGILVWGTRTMSPNEETNQISVRRVLSYVQRSIYVGTQWAVFEPNDPSLWKRLKARIEVFLEDIWKKGLLVGDSPEQAYFVQCDAETTTERDRDEGRVNILIMVKPVRSTEFIVLRITQEGGMASPGAGAEEE